MQKARKFNFLSLYFSSIGFKESLQSFFALFTLPFVNEDKLRSIEDYEEFFDFSGYNTIGVNFGL